VAPGGAQTRPVSTALSPLPAWRVPAPRPPGTAAAAAFPDHFPLQRFQPPARHPVPPPVMRTISYETERQQQQQQQQAASQIVPSSGAYWSAAFNAPPSQQPVDHVRSVHFRLLVQQSTERNTHTWASQPLRH